MFFPSQVFQKCLVKDKERKGLVKQQIRELRSGALLPLKDKKVIEMASLPLAAGFHLLLVTDGCP